MNIDKAIEIKLRKGYELSRTDPRDMGEADRLSIEALKHFRDFRLTCDGHPIYLLPGETEE